MKDLVPLWCGVEAEIKNAGIAQEGAKNALLPEST